MAARKELLGPEVRKLQPRLRMVANGSTEVNAIRCEQSAALAVDQRRPPEAVALRAIAFTPPVTRQELPDGVERGSLEATSDQILVNVFVETVAAGEGPVQIAGETARKREPVTATMALSALRSTVEQIDFAWVEAGETLAIPRPAISNATPAPPTNARRVSRVAKHHGGAGVLVGVIDVAGFDYAHPDFLDAQSRTRFVRIWAAQGCPAASRVPSSADRMWR